MTERTEIEESWDTLESFGFPPEACGWPHTDITGLLPEAIECALKCLIQQREDLAAELVKLRAIGEKCEGDEDMTRSGGKPHTNVGDRGQRYEVRATGYPKDEESVIGWSDDIAGGSKMAAAIRLAPGCTSTRIFDRQENRLVITSYAGILR